MLQAEYKYQTSQLDFYTDYLTKNKTQVMTGVSTKKKLKKGLLLKLGIICFVYALLLVFLCVKSATIGYQINGLENDIKSIETDNSMLQYQISQQSSLDNIEKIATQDLKMYKPDLNVAMTIDAINNPNQVSVAQNDNKIAVQPTPGLLQKISNSLLLLADRKR